MSVKVEGEQDEINKSVKVDVASQRTTTSLPLVNNPSIKLAHNKERALKVNNQQIKKLYQNTDDKKDVIESEEKLQQLGYVDYGRNLKLEQQAMLRRSEIQILFHGGQCGRDIPSVHHADLFLMLHSLQPWDGV